MDSLEKTCDHNLLVNATRERIKDGEKVTDGRCVTCHEAVKISYEYHQIGKYHYGKKDILLEVNCSG